MTRAVVQRAWLAAQPCPKPWGSLSRALESAPSRLTPAAIERLRAEAARVNAGDVPTVTGQGRAQ